MAAFCLRGRRSPSRFARPWGERPTADSDEGTTKRVPLVINRQQGDHGSAAFPGARTGSGYRFVCPTFSRGQPRIDPASAPGIRRGRYTSVNATSTTRREVKQMAVDARTRRAGQPKRGITVCGTRQDERQRRACVGKWLLWEPFAFSRCRAAMSRADSSDWVIPTGRMSWGSGIPDLLLTGSGCKPELD